MTITISKYRKENSIFIKGKAIEDYKKTEAYNIIQEEISKMRDEAMYHVLSVDVESREWRSRLKCLDEIMGIPDLIIKRAKIAQETEE